MTTGSSGRMKAGQSIRRLGPELMSRVALHPLQFDGFETVRDLLDGLDACRSTSAADLYELQRQLFGAIYQVETRRAGCSKAAKRCQAGKLPQAGAPDLPTGADPRVVESWDLEVFVCERLARQLRCVGDGLAWKAFGFDRRFILALSRNEPSGPIVGKAGLDYELGRVTDLWAAKHRFGLLHDLTTCLRISDVTEFGDGQILLHEVKKSGRTLPAQTARAQAVVDSITGGGPLPGTGHDTRFTMLSTRFRADMRPVRDAIALARERGVQGIGLPEGRVMIAASVFDLHRIHKDDPTHGVRQFDAARTAAIKRARIDHATHHMVGNSGDTAGRSPTTAPLSIFPLKVDDRAALICDDITFETVVSVDVLVQLLQARDFQVDVLYPDTSQEVDPRADVLRVQWGDRSLTARAAAMNPLMFELLRPSVWCDAVAETFELPTPPTHPVAVLAGENRVWR